MSSSASSRRSRGSVPRPRGGSSRLFDGMKRNSSRIAARHAGSESCAKCATPDVAACVSAPPSSSIVTSSCVTVFTTFGPGDEHVRRAAHHVDEVGDRRRIHRAAGARPEDRRDLRHDAGGERVAQEDVGVAAERDDAFLDARAARVVEADHRRAVPHREIHDLADLLGDASRTASRRTR